MQKANAFVRDDISGARVNLGRAGVNLRHASAKLLL